MSALIFGLAVLVALGLGGGYLRAVPIAERTLLLRRAGAVLAFVVALWLALTNRFFLAVPLAFFGYFVLWRRQDFTIRPERLAGGARVSSVRTAFLQMTLEQATGALSGHVLAGTFTGRDLAGLTRAELAQVWRECRAGEAQSRQLLEAYLDRRWPEWRAEMPRSGAGDGTNGAGGSQQKTGGSSDAARARTPMTRDEALEVLGLASSASLDDIKSAHRSLMKRLHPDQGGSNYLAAKINEAKDILTGKRP